MIVYRTTSFQVGISCYPKSHSGLICQYFIHFHTNQQCNTGFRDQGIFPSQLGSALLGTAKNKTIPYRFPQSQWISHWENLKTHRLSNSAILELIKPARNLHLQRIYGDYIEIIQRVYRDYIEIIQRLYRDYIEIILYFLMIIP